MVKRLAEVRRLADAQPKNNDLCGFFKGLSEKCNPLCFGDYVGDEFCLDCCFKSSYKVDLAQKILSVLEERKDKEEIKKDSFLQPENLVKEIVDCRYHSSFRIRLKVLEIKDRFPFWKKLQRKDFLEEVKKIVKAEKENRRSQKDKGRQSRNYWINWINKRIKEE